MRRHLSPVALALSFREIIERQLARCDTAPKNQSTVAIITGDIIAVVQLNAQPSQRLVSHPADVKMSFALAVKVLLAQIAVPTFQQDCQETQFIFAGN